MANTTNYNWETPDDTDLVKDGAAAIRTLGSSVDTTTKALNPSTTLGDIEYRSATANTNTRLAIGTTGQVLTVAGGVPSWATSDDANAIQNAIVDAKGDLIAASAADTPARLAVGANGTVLTADSAEATGLKWATASGGKVVQIVSANYSTVASNSTSTYAATGLTASITPSSASNKILIWAHIAEVRKSDGNQHNQINLGLKRGSTYIKETLGLYTATAIQLSVPSHIFVYEDSPATTSSTTYAVDFANYNNTASVSINYNAALFSSVGSSIILMEVTP